MSITVYAPDETLQSLFKSTTLPNINQVSIGSYKSKDHELTNSLRNNISIRIKKDDYIHLLHPTPPLVLPIKEYKVIFSAINVTLPFATFLYQKYKCQTPKERVRAPKESTDKQTTFPWPNKFRKAFISKISSRYSAFRNHCRVLYCLIFSDVIDVLNPMNFLILKRIPVLRKKIRLTRGASPYQISSLPAINLEKKTDTIVFAGRLEEQKGIRILLEILPILNDKATKTNNPLKIKVLGRGSLQAEIVSFLNKNKLDFISVDIDWADDTFEQLQVAKVFLSLQNYSNFPSRALAEAMLMGAVPIVLNTGDSRIMLPQQYSWLIERDHAAENLVNSIFQIINLEPKAFNAISLNIINFAMKRFEHTKQLRYYTNLYTQ